MLFPPAVRVEGLRSFSDNNSGCYPIEMAQYKPTIVGDCHNQGALSIQLQYPIACKLKYKSHIVVSFHKGGRTKGPEVDHIGVEIVCRKVNLG